MVSLFVTFADNFTNKQKMLINFYIIRLFFFSFNHVNSFIQNSPYTQATI